MVVDFIDMSLKILVGTIFCSSPFLSTPSDESDSPFWSETVLKEEPKSFEYSNESSPVIVGTSLWSSVPSVDMTPSNNDFVGFFCTFNLENKIIWRCTIDKLIFHL